MEYPDNYNMYQYVNPDDLDLMNEAFYYSDDSCSPHEYTAPSMTKDKPNFYVVPELIKREIGSNKFFHHNLYGSSYVIDHLQLLYSMTPFGKCANIVNFNEDGSLLAFGFNDRKVTIWDWEIGRVVSTFESGHTMEIAEMKWLPSIFNSIIVTIADDGRVRLYDMNANVQKKLCGYNEACRSLAIHPDNPHEVVAVGDNGKVFSIDIRTEKPTMLLQSENIFRMFRSSHHVSFTIDINPRNANEFCIAGFCVEIFDRRRPLDPMQSLYSERQCITQSIAAVYNYDGTEIVASHSHDDLYLFNTKNSNTPKNTYVHRYTGHCHSDAVKSINFFGPKSEFIISGTNCGSIVFWDKNTEAMIRWLSGDKKNAITHIELHPSLPILATCDTIGDVIMYEFSLQTDLSDEFEKFSI